MEQNLIPGEKIRVRAELSWVPFWTALISGLVILSLVLFVVIATTQQAAGGAGGALCCFLIFIPLILAPAAQALAGLLTTELAVTDKRLIGKTGLVRRASIEMLLSKAESVAVDQGLFGRMLGYGTIVVVGTGGTKLGFPLIKNPTEFRRHIAHVSDQLHSVGASSPLPAQPSASITTVTGQPIAKQALFEVQVVDRNTGAERWIEVRAESIESAIQLVANTGEMVGQARLKSIT